MATLLSLIGENERFRIRPKNLPPTDDVTENGFSSYLDDYGTVALQDYTNDTNVESSSVLDIGTIAIADRKDYNVFPQDTYSEAEVERIDVSVIDMPSIEDISDDIYLSNTTYNKYANLQYIPYEVQDAVGGQTDDETYGQYIGKILSNLEQRGNSLADIFIGQFNKDDSPIGVIGGQSLFKALQNQFVDGIERKIFSIVNKSLLNILDGGELIRQDYNITTGKTFLGRAAEFAAKLAGLENPISYLPEDAFNFNRTKSITNGKVTYLGSGLSYSEQVNLMLEYTGKGQQKQLLSLLEMNIYHDKIEGRKKTLEANLYIPYIIGYPTSLNAKDFIVAETNATGEYFEPYGVISRHKNLENISLPVDKQLFSDGNWFQWTTDSKKSSIGWIKTNTNNFNPKSILFKTQELLKENANISAFLDLSEKSFDEVIDGDVKTISRSDGTTASKTYIADDGTTIFAGDYFRVWTKERGYNRLSRTLRHRALDNGDRRSVLNENGIPNYAPTTRTTLQGDDVIKRYMFSLENLAWNDHMDDLPECEQGAGDPLTGTRGRIMWFPPYNLEFDENVNVGWNDHSFIGRGEKMYTYNNTDRTGKLSFSILVDHPDIVHLKELQGAKTQYWERYFKGDKAVELDAIDKYNKQKKITPNELDALNVIKKPIPPKYKKVTKTIKTVKKVEQEKKVEVKKKEEQKGFGETILSIYFANNDTTVSRSTFVPNLASIEPDSIPDKTINFPEMKLKNIGYEDGGKADGFISSDGYAIKTSNGLEYKDSKGNVVNKAGITTQATYNKGIIKAYTIVDCKIKNEAFQDTTNFNLNKEFYFEWQKKFVDAISGKSKVQVTFIGNASKPKAAESYTNKILSTERADNAAKWFDANVKPLLKNLNINVEFAPHIKDYKSDQEDTEKDDANKKSGGTLEGTYCKECNRPFLKPCKKSRRVDIYIKDLSPVDAEPIPQPETSGNTIEEVQTLEEYILDTDEGNTDPNNDTTPNIDESIINKLIYTECDFFKYLEINDPIAYQTISEKIKYFTPAFHSITPQGFNSRLTFLHQCTRQGESIGLDGVDNVKNLAFGRPPVCILRIGDFFHTKIIIESVNIVYKNNSIKWDLNPEGIGVQPMYADISLGIKILGGMSMTAPINRLQNALSFNFYANTEMYDARADSVVFQQQFNSEGSLDYNATYGTPKAAKIVDGIKLSSLIKIDDATRQAKLAKIRQQSRLNLPNSTDAIVPTDQIGTLGTVGSILEFKKRAGLPLTEREKIDKKVEDETKDKFQLTNLAPIDVTKIKITMSESMKAENSLLNQQSKEIFKSALNPKNPDDVAKIEDLMLDVNRALRATNNTNPYNSKFPDSMEKLKDFTESINQYSQGSMGNPSEFTEENKNNTAEEYLDAFKNVWINKTGKGGFIKF